MYFATPTGPATFHEGGFTTTYRATGDHLRDHGGRRVRRRDQPLVVLPGRRGRGRWTRSIRRARRARPARSWPWATRSPTARSPHRARTTATPTSWPNDWSRRAGPLGVVNVGINGNKVRTDSTCLGESALNRFERDVLNQPRRPYGDRAGRDQRHRHGRPARHRLRRVPCRHRRRPHRRPPGADQGRAPARGTHPRRHAHAREGQRVRLRHPAQRGDQGCGQPLDQDQRRLRRAWSTSIGPLPIRPTRTPSSLRTTAATTCNEPAGVSAWAIARAAGRTCLGHRRGSHRGP